MLTLGEINALWSFEKTPKAREDNLNALKNHLRLTDGQKQLSTMWDVGGRLDNNKPLIWCGGKGAVPSSVVESAAGRLTCAMRQSAQPWRYQQQLVDLARETGQTPPVVKNVLCNLRRADDEAEATTTKRRRKAGVGIVVWDSLHPLSEALEEMWCYEDWRGVATALEEEFGVNPPGRVSSFALLDALYSIARWAQERNETEQLARAAKLLRLFYSHPGHPRQAVLLLSLPLAARSCAHDLRSVLDDCARLAADDPDALVRALGYVLNWRLSGASAWNMLPDDWGNAELRRLAAGQGTEQSEVRHVLARLEGTSLEQQLGGILSLANMSNFYVASLNSFKLYWELVVRKLLVLMQSPVAAISWAVVVALRTMTRNLLDTRGELPDLMVFYLVDVIRSHPLLSAAMACKALEDSLNDPLRCELVARLGLQSRSSPAGLRFATAAMLSKVGCRPERLTEVRRLFHCVLEDSDPVGQDSARWGLRRLKLAERAGDAAPPDRKQNGEGPKGVVDVVGGGIAEIKFLPGIAGGEVLEFPGGARGVVVGLGHNQLGAVIRGGDAAVKKGDRVSRTKEVVEMEVGDELLGRVVNPFGHELDGKGPIAARTKKRVGYFGAGASTQSAAEKPLQTGVKPVDEAAPFGVGERILVVGCTGLGKTSLVIDTILNQKGKEVVCVYVAVGHNDSDAERAVKALEEGGAMDYTVVVKSTASDPLDLRLLAPYAGATVGRYFSEAGRHALTIYDDMWGPTAYPGTAALSSLSTGQLERTGGALYTHTLMIQYLLRASRAGGGGGSLTSMVVLDTSTSELPWQLVAASDGQIAFDPHLFRHGVRPAVDVGRSTSRARDAARLSRVWQQTRVQAGGGADRASRAGLLFENPGQPGCNPVEIEKQVLVAWTAARGYHDDVRVEHARRFESELLRFAENSRPDLLRRLAAAGRVVGELETELECLIKTFKRTVWDAARMGDERLYRAAGHHRAVG